MKLSCVLQWMIFVVKRNNWTIQHCHDFRTYHRLQILPVFHLQGISCKWPWTWRRTPLCGRLVSVRAAVGVRSARLSESSHSWADRHSSWVTPPGGPTDGNIRPIRYLEKRPTQNTYNLSTRKNWVLSKKQNTQIADEFTTNRRNEHAAQCKRF